MRARVQLRYQIVCNVEPALAAESILVLKPSEIALPGGKVHGS